MNTAHSQHHLPGLGAIAHWLEEHLHLRHEPQVCPEERRIVMIKKEGRSEDLRFFTDECELDEYVQEH